MNALKEYDLDTIALEKSRALSFDQRSSGTDLENSPLSWVVLAGNNVS